MLPIGRILNIAPAETLNEPSTRLRKPIHPKNEPIMTAILCAIKKFNDVNHTTQAVNPNTPPNIVAKIPPIMATDTYRNIAEPIIYIANGKTNMDANITLAKAKTRVTDTRRMSIQTKNRMIPSTPKPRPPVATNGLAIMKKGRKFQRY